jgi:hypothetical protein
MSKTKELDEIAQGVAEVTKELMHDSIDWQLGDYPLDGDDYEDLHDMVMFLAVEKMYMSTRRRYYDQDDSYLDGLAASMIQD